MHKLQHWQIFLLFFLPIFVSLHVEDNYYRDLIKTASLLPIFIHFISINSHLTNHNKGETNYYFNFNCVYLIVITTWISALGDEILGAYAENYLILVVVLMAYALIAFIHIADQLAIQLRKAEEKVNEKYRQFPDFLLFFMWPIGLWFYQPRVNRIP